MLLERLISRLEVLLPNKDVRFAIAYSGGSDSTALTHALKDHPQLKCVYILDHALREGSDIEAQHACEFAVGLGLEAKIITWDSPDISSGIQTQARHARYALIGQACRRDGIEFLLTGHHSDDQAETIFMRFEHETGWRGAAGMAEKTYAPVWPDLACVTVLRPLLDVPRAHLTEYNLRHGIPWMEDPSNRNLKFERVRARDYLADHPEMVQDLLAAQQDIRMGLNQERELLAAIAKEQVRVDENGIIRLYKLCPPELLYHLLRVASGEGRLINRSKITRLLDAMKKPRFTSATLGGALIRRNPSEPGFLICRDLVAVTGRKDNKVAPRALKVQFNNHHQIWDGRFTFWGPSQYVISSAYAAREYMKPDDMKRLREHPAAVRQTLPIVLMNDRVVSIGGLLDGETAPYELRALNKSRLEHLLATKLP